MDGASNDDDYALRNDAVPNNYPTAMESNRVWVNLPECENIWSGVWMWLDVQSTFCAHPGTGC